MRHPRVRADSFQIKPLSPLRSSDRRKIADQIISDFQIEIPKAEVDDNVEKTENDQASGAVGVGSLRSSLLPEGSQNAKFTTTAGPDLKQVSGTVYVGSHPGDEQRVLWIKIEERLVPSVYTLWKHPRLLPLLHTPDIVLCKLQGKSLYTHELPIVSSFSLSMPTTVLQKYAYGTLSLRLIAKLVLEMFPLT